MAVPLRRKPAIIPPWGRDRLREYQLGRQKEAPILSDFAEAPIPSIKVEGEYPGFRIRSVRVNQTGSPTYHYGIPTPEQRPRPRVLVKGTPKASQWAGQTMRGTAPESLLAKGQPRPSTPSDHADSAGTGWKLAWKPAKTIVRSMVDTIRGGKTRTSFRAESVAAPPPPPKDPKDGSSNRVENDDEQYFMVDTEWEGEILADRTSPHRKTILPPSSQSHPKDAHENSEHDVDMTGHIPAAERGKGARFAIPVVQPTSLLQDARKAKMERRRREMVELEAKMRRIEAEYEAAISRLTTLESEQRALEVAEKLQRDLLNDASNKKTSMQGKSESEGTSSAARNSTRKDDAPTMAETDPRPTPSPKPINRIKKTANETNPSRNEGKSTRKRSGESDKKSRNHNRKEEPADDGDSQDIAIHTAELVLELQKDMIEDLVKAQLEKLQFSTRLERDRFPEETIPKPPR